jgi:hypothetical protein
MHIQSALLALCFIITIGCASTFEETHYFKILDSPQSPRADNYFKVHVSGFTLLSSTRYLSGYFDESAVDDYFNEIYQPQKGEFIKPEPASSSAKPLDSKLAGRSLVMILSTNSDEIATQIGTIAENERTSRALSRLINRDKILGAKTSRAALEIQKVKGQVLTGLGDKLVAGINPETISKIDTNRQLLEYLNALAGSLENEQPFGSIKEASSWISLHRNRFLRQ